ncbi:unnamed protein product [Caenorhabditis angaria]|uniref:Uncharacterized protein n=1 Tax=Caenorhabditis angaria TaxID=860376 RepID=A0A9P1J370_9PELO|nr:unnamed protein product [Caenorhabditis angaria]
MAIHHFDENLDRNNNVILRKLKTSELSVKSIDNLMKELSHEHRFSISQITSIITDPKHIKYFNNFQSTNIFKSFHVCIDDFARAVLRISQFDTSLQSLRVILEKILNDDDMLAKFELLVKAKCAKFDITVSQSSTWFECLEMLAMIVEDEQNFQLISTFSQRWLPDNVLNENSTSHLTILLKILKDINTFAKIASYEDGTISSVIPLVLEMISTLETEHLPIPISAALNTLIDCHLKVFLDSNQSSLYDIAMFMDPRYANSDRIYTHDRWASIELIVKVLISDEGQETARAKNPTVPDAAGIFTREVSRELVVYHNLINSIRPGLQVTDCSLWWTRQRSKLPILFRKAKEFFSVPLCTLDAKYFFGKGGKFSFLNATMSYRQFQNALIVASEQEIFKGRGFYASVVPEFNMNGSPSTSDIKSESPSTHQKAPPLPAKIASFAAIRNNSQQLEDEKCARIRKQNLVLMKQPLDTSRFIRRNRPELDDDLDDYLMIPPPPVLEQMCERPKSVEKPQEPSEIICKIEADEVKKEILDPSEIKKEIEDPDDQPSQQMAGVEVKTEEPDF